MGSGFSVNELSEVFQLRQEKPEHLYRHGNCFVQPLEEVIRTSNSLMSVLGEPLLKVSRVPIDPG